jgi:hypothetical protein
MKKFYCIVIFCFACYNVLSQDPGFFLNDLTPKQATTPVYTEVSKPSGEGAVSVQVDFSNEITPISKYLFGNNANIYMTQMVDQPVLLDHIRKLSPNVIRFPGGNLSSVYFWDAEKGAPPLDAPAQLVDAEGFSKASDYWYGKNKESWTMSLDNYYEMLRKTNSTGIITVNYGFARYSTASDPVASAAHLAAEWVRYDNGRTKFWEIGNESNGTWQAGHRIKTTDNKDGQPEIITGELYGKHFNVFADSMRKAAIEVGATIYVGAQLLAEAPASWWNATDRQWNTGVFSQSKNLPDFYIIHSYYTPFAQNSKAEEILGSATKVTKEMMDYVTKSQQDAGLIVKPVALTEWNIFAEGSKQQASYINGMQAALVLGELIKNKYGFAARWDLANGWGNGNDHGMFNQGDEPGAVPKWNPRAAYYYMYYFQKFTGDRLFASTVTGSENIESYATRFNSGEAGIVLVNKGTSAETVDMDFTEFGFGDRYYTYTLTGGNDNGEFSLKVFVNGAAPTHATGGPLNFETIHANGFNILEGVRVALPPRSVQYIMVENGNNVITSTEDESETGVLVYPNKVKGKITIVFNSPDFTSLSLVNAQGKTLFTETIKVQDKTKQIDAPLVSGIYFLRFSKAGKAIIKKIVVE